MLVNGLYTGSYYVEWGCISQLIVGVSFQTYDRWKESMPDMKWMNDYLPDTEQWDSFRGSLVGMKDKIKDNIEIGTVSILYT